MTIDFRPFVAALAFALAGCYPPLPAEWTAAEAPKTLTVDSVAKQIDLRFAGGSDRLLPADVARLRRMAAYGDIAPSDRVRVAVGGGPGLAEARFAMIAQELLSYGIVASRMSGAGIPANSALIDTGRFLVATPPCPNWSRYPAMDFSNAHPSNWGCATAVDLARVVESPADLVRGRRGGPSDGVPAASAVQRYEADRVVLPTGAGLTTIGVSGGTPTPGVGGTAGPPPTQP